MLEFPNKYKYLSHLIVNITADTEKVYIAWHLYLSM